MKALVILFFAIIIFSLIIFRKLLSDKKDLLTDACKNGNLQSVKKLVEEQGVKLTDESYNQSLLLTACENNNFEVFKYLFEHINIKTINSKSVLSGEILDTGNLDLIKYLITEKDCAFYVTEKNLIDIYENKNIELCKYLIERAIIEPVDTKEEFLEKGLLSYLCEKKESALVKYLIRNNKMDIKKREQLGEPLLSSACKSGDLELVSI